MLKVALHNHPWSCWLLPLGGYSLLIMATQHLLQVEGSCCHRFSDKMMDVLLFCSNMGSQILFRRLVVDVLTLSNNSVLLRKGQSFSLIDIQQQKIHKTSHVCLIQIFATCVFVRKSRWSETSLLHDSKKSVRICILSFFVDLQ